MKKVKRLMCMFILIGVCFFLACGISGCELVEPVPTSHEIGSKATEEAVSAIIKNDTLPKITKSLERANIKRRTEFINQPDKIGYLYLLTVNGQLVEEAQVLGKVSSLNSYLTPMEELKIVDSYGRVYSPNEFPGATHSIASVITVEAPDLDGSYGANSEGIFWFSPDGVYQEWNGNYRYSAERLSYVSPPVLVESAK